MCNLYAVNDTVSCFGGIYVDSIIFVLLTSRCTVPLTMYSTVRVYKRVCVCLVGPDIPCLSPIQQYLYCFTLSPQHPNVLISSCEKEIYTGEKTGEGGREIGREGGGWSDILFFEIFENMDTLL